MPCGGDFTLHRVGPMHTTLECQSVVVSKINLARLPVRSTDYAAAAFLLAPNCPMKIDLISARGRSIEPFKSRTGIYLACPAGGSYSTFSPDTAPINVAGTESSATSTTQQCGQRDASAQ